MKKLLFIALLFCGYAAAAQTPPKYTSQLTYTAAGTNTYTVTITGYPYYRAGDEVKILFTNANTGTATLNINSLGAINLRKNGSTPLASGDLVAGSTYILSYDGTNFQVLNIPGSGGGGGGWALTGNTTLTGAANIIGTSSNTIKHTFNSLGTTVTDGAGLWLSNTTAATSGNQQISPNLLFEAQGYETLTPQSRAIRLKQYIKPVQSAIAYGQGTFNSDVSFDGGTTYNTVLSTDVFTGKTIMNPNINTNNPPLIEFVRNSGGVEVGRGSVGYLGTTEMNMSVNMDYTTGSHLPYNNAQNSLWQFMSNTTNSWGLQWIKSGNTVVPGSWWSTYGRVPFSVDVLPSGLAVTNANTQGLGQAVRGGSKVTLQQIAMIDDNYTSSDALIKMSGQIMSISGGAASVTMPAINIGSGSIAGTELAHYKYTGGNSYLFFENTDNSSAYNQYRFIKNKAASYNIGAATKIVEFEHNTVAFNGSRATSTVNGGFSNVEFYWNTTNTAGSSGDRFIIGQDGQIGVGGANYGTSGQVLTSQGIVSAPIWANSGGNFGYTTTATTAGTTALTASSSYLQFFTGSTTQTVTLPSNGVSGSTATQFYIRNRSTGAVTVNASGGGTVIVLAGNTHAIVTCLTTNGTTTSDWSALYQGYNYVSGKIMTFNNSLTFTGTDGTTMTFPSTSATIARTDAAQTFTGVQSMTSPAITTSITTPSASFDAFNTTATTLNLGGAATTLTLGATTGTMNLRNVTLTAANATSFAMNGASPSITTTSTGTASVFNTAATTGNLFGAGTTVSIGAATGTATINNVTTAMKHLDGTTAAPGIAAGTGAGTTPTVSMGTNSNDISGIINVTTGTTPTGTNAIVVTITFNTSYVTAPFVTLTPANRNAQALTGATAVLVPAAGQTNGVTTTTFVIESGATALTASTAYIWAYHVIQ